MAPPPALPSGMGGEDTVVEGVEVLHLLHLEVLLLRLLLWRQL